MVVDGQAGPVYDGFLRGSRLVFDDARRLHGLAERDREVLRVEIGIVPVGEPKRQGRKA